MTNEESMTNPPDPAELPDNVLTVFDGRKVTWSYEKKVSDGNFGSEGLSLFVTDTCPPDQGNVHMWAANVTPHVVSNMKAHVWDGLGLPFSYDSEGVPHLDAMVPGPATTPVIAPPPTQVAAPPPMPAPQPQQVRPGAPVPQGQPRANPADQNSYAQYGVHAQHPGNCPDCGGTEFWDNRTRQDQNMLDGAVIGPDFKCKNKGCEKKIYRPGSFPYNQAIKTGRVPQAAQPIQTAPPQQMQQPHPHPPMHLPPEPVPVPDAPEYGPDEAPF